MSAMLVLSVPFAIYGVASTIHSSSPAAHQIEPQLDGDQFPATAIFNGGDRFNLKIDNWSWGPPFNNWIHKQFPESLWATANSPSSAELTSLNDDNLRSLSC